MEGGLTEASNDVNSLEEVFRRHDFNYQIIKRQNEEATKENLEEILDDLHGYLGKYKNNTENKVLIFVFSGHGAMGNNLVMHKINDYGPKVSLGKSIIPKFFHFVEIPKLFFIDVCRGSDEIERTGEQPRRVIPDRKVKNFLIAHSTPENFISYNASGWMRALSERIDQCPTESLSTILDDVAGNARKDMQPEYLSRLRGSFRFVNPAQQEAEH